MHGDEGAFRRWMSFELDTLHAGLVSQRRALADLLAEPSPSAPARGGTHAFDPRELARLAEALPPELRLALRLPLHLYSSTDVPDSMYVQDRPAGEALRLLGYAVARADGQGRVWFGRAAGLQALRDWPTSVQLVHL